MPDVRHFTARSIKQVQTKCNANAVMKRVKITQDDGFVWHVLTETEAIRTFANGGCVFLLYDDDTEAEANSIEEIKTHIRRGGYVGVEVGFIDDNENKH